MRRKVKIDEQMVSRTQRASKVEKVGKDTLKNLK